MRRRQLGRTGLEVSELGYGAWGIGRAQWLGADDDASLRALARAFELGVDFVDTALAYGDGHSEQLVGKAVRAAGGGIRVATKVPPRNGEWPARAGVPADDVFPADWVVECTERSLRNLGLDAIDLQQFHVWSDEWVDEGSWREAVEQPEGRRQDPALRHLGQRPRAGQRRAPGRERRGRVGAGDLQHLRAAARRRDPAGRRAGRGRRDRPRALRRGRADRANPPRHDLPRGRLAQRLLRRRPQDGGVGARARARARSWASPSRTCPRSPCASASPTPPSRR